MLGWAYHIELTRSTQRLKHSIRRHPCQHRQSPPAAFQIGWSNFLPAPQRLHRHSDPYRHSGASRNPASAQRRFTVQTA